MPRPHASISEAICAQRSRGAAFAAGAGAGRGAGALAAGSAGFGAAALAGALDAPFADDFAGALGSAGGVVGVAGAEASGAGAAGVVSAGLASVAGVPASVAGGVAAGAGAVTSGFASVAGAAVSGWSPSMRHAAHAQTMMISAITAITMNGLGMPPEAGASAAAAGAPGAVAVAEAEAAAAESAALACAGTLPAGTSAAPHFLQKRPSAGLSKPQIVHFIVASPRFRGRISRPGASCISDGALRKSPPSAGTASWDNRTRFRASHPPPSPPVFRPTMKLTLRTLLAVLCALPVLAAYADEPPVTDPMAILGAAKAATGGSAWNDLRTQHSRVTLSTGGLAGPVERWSEFLTGRSYLTYAIGPSSGAAGFDGTIGWTADASGDSRIESAQAARELAVNTAFRDRLGFWFPSRYPAKITFKDREHRDDADFDVVSVVPEGGREFDLWINADTHLIERLTEQEAEQMRTEYYMDFREVDGVRIPFRVRASRGDPRFDEIITVDSIDFAAPQKPVSFARPAPPAPDYTFPAGKSEVEVPFTLANGHIYVEVKLAGKGPFLMLLDAGGANVLVPRTAEALGTKPPGAAAAKAGSPAAAKTGDAAPAGPALTHVGTLEIGGLSITDQTFVTLPLDAQMRRIEGMDRVAGLFGYELLRRFPTRIDYAQKRIVLYAPAQWTYHGDGVRVPLAFSGDVAQVEGSVDGIAGVFAIDTGSRASLTLTSPFVDDNRLVDKYHAGAETTIGAGVGGPARARLARSEVLKLGNVEVPAPVTLLSTATSGPLANPAVAGDVGYGVLHRFNVVLDYRNQSMWLEKNAAFNDKDVHDRAGVWVERGSNGIAVVDVLPKGPAAEAGLKPGDTVRSVDGKPVAGVTLDAFRTLLKGPPGSKVRLTLANGRTLVITLRDLV